ncbi:MAG TPA: NAD-dependent epimerase/dehydratase family protein [Polyangiaceae bacterium]
MNAQRILVTGAAGFIGSSVADALLEHGHEVFGFDNFDPYYDPSQKHRNIQRALASSRYRFNEGDVRSAEDLRNAFDAARPDAVIHLAARAGVRASVMDPLTYAEVNEIGGLRVLMECHARNDIPVVYASTSSVYGKSTRLPFREDDDASTPLSPYAASKRASELMAFSFHEIHRLPVAILRFFTVYGPRGRPDMAFFKFTSALLADSPIRLHGESTERDFTYIDDIVAGVTGALDWVLRTRSFDTFNLGRSEPIVVRRVIELLGKELDRAPHIVLGALELGEAHRTAANVSHARLTLGYEPRIGIEEGVSRWVHWLRHSAEAPPLLRSV